MLSRGKFLVSAFITWSAIGFAIDLLLVNYQPLGQGFFWPIFFGTLGAAVSAARIGRTGLVPVLLLITGAGPMHDGKDIMLRLTFANAGTVTVIALVTNPQSGGSSYFLN